MTNLTITIYDVENNKLVEREMNEQEIEQYKKDESELKQREAQAELEAQIKATAKNALLDKLGITEAEAKLLLGN